MHLSRLFILRPVATSLLMAAILLVGAVTLSQLPVSALPQVDYPTIQVLTFYPGASPDVVTSTITAPRSSPPHVDLKTLPTHQSEYGRHARLTDAASPTASAA